MFNQCPICYNETVQVYEMGGQLVCPSCFMKEYGGEGSGNFGHGGLHGVHGGSGEGGDGANFSHIGDGEWKVTKGDNELSISRKSGTDWSVSGTINGEFFKSTVESFKDAKQVARESINDGICTL